MRALAAITGALAILALSAPKAGAERAGGTPAAAPLEAALGSGSWAERLACVACIGSIYAAGGGTPLGIAVTVWLIPQPAVACGIVCYMAAT